MDGLWGWWGRGGRDGGADFVVGGNGGWWGRRIRVGVRFLLFYSRLSLTGPWRGVLRASLARGCVVVGGGRAMPDGHSLRHFPNVS